MRHTIVKQVVSLKGFFVLLLTSPIWFLIIDRFYGVYVAKRMCRDDGGETMFASTYVGGYLRSAEMIGAYCVDCMTALPAHKFEFIDVYLPTRGHIPGMKEPGFYRYTLSTVDDPRCDVWENNQQYKGVKHSYPFKADECLAVERLTGPASNYSWKQVGTRIPIVGGLFFIGRRDTIVYEVDSARVLSRTREYSYQSRTTWLIETASTGFANADIRCGGQPGIIELLQRTLRDPSKRGTTG